MDDLYEDFSKTLAPDEYERYLVFRQRRDQERLEGTLMHRASDWVGRDPVPPTGERSMHQLLLAVREADAKFETRNKETKPMTETTKTYNTQEMMNKLGVSQPTLNIWKRSGKIPENAVVSPGVYKKPVIDDLFAAGELSKSDQVTKLRERPRNKTTIPTRSRTTGQSLRNETTPRRESYPASHTAEFWQSHASLAARVLVLPENSLPLVLECVNTAMKFMSEKQ